MAHRYLALFTLLLIKPTHAAAQFSIADEIRSIEVHGFVSPGAILTTNNNYLAKSKHGSVEFTEVGINFTKSLTDRLRVGVQLFARDLGPLGNYSARMDWFYLDYKFQDWLGFRAGRVKLPFGLYNELNDIDSARVPILLPQSIYPVGNREFLLAQTGGELYGYIDLDEGGALEYRAYGGTIFVNAELLMGNPFAIENFSVPYVVGGRILWETPLEGLRLGGSIEALRFDAKAVAIDTSSASIRVPAVLWITSVEYSAHDVLLAAEYSRWHVDLDSSNEAVVPNLPLTTSERAFVLTSYRINPWLHPGLYYGVLFPDIKHRNGRAGVQHDLAATVRFDINEHWLLKIEAHYMNGTADLDPTLNNNTPRSELKRSWGLFLVKTTAYF